MNLHDYVRVLSRRWLTLYLVVAIFLLLGQAYLFLSPGQYVARSQIFFSVGTTQETTGLTDISSFSQQRVKSYAEAALSTRALQPVIDTLDLETDPGTLRQSMEVAVPLDTVVLDIAVRQPTREAAVEVARAHTQSVLQLVSELEAPVSPGYSVTSVVLQDGALDQGRDGPSALIIATLSLFAGLIAGVLLSILRDVRDPHVQDETDLRSLVDRLSSKDQHGPPLPALKDARIVPSHQVALSLNGDHGPGARSSLLISPGSSSVLAGVGTLLGRFLAETGRSTCIVDLDVERSPLAQKAHVDAAPGLTDALDPRSRYDLPDVATLWWPPSGWLIPSGSDEAARRVRGLVGLGSDVVGKLTESYESVVFLGAAGGSDGLTEAVQRQVEHTLIVVRLGDTRKEDLHDMLVATAHAHPSIPPTIVVA